MQRKANIRLLSIGFAASSILVATTVFDAIQGEPFKMSLWSEKGESFVQFGLPAEGLTSRKFPVKVPVDAPQVVDLRSRSSAIPGCKIEFFDTTILPGRFKIRIGASLYDVMERGIFVDGKEFEWRHH